MGGSSDPRLNKHLANAIEAAKKTQVCNNDHSFYKPVRIGYIRVVYSNMIKRLR